MTPPKPVDLEEIKETIDYLFKQSEARELLNTERDMLCHETSELGDMFSREIVELILIAREAVPTMITEIEYLRARVKELEDRPIEIDTSNDKIIRILTKKLEELTAENERLRDGRK